MNTQQNLTALGGGALIAANFWTDQRHAFAGGALNNDASGKAQQSAHDVVKTIAIELAFVGVLVLLAGASSAAGNAIVAVIAALALVWLMRHYAKG
jgi:hypothetical protein